MADTHKVVKGDTLSEIAEKYYKQYGYSSIYGDSGYLNYLAKINSIKNPNCIKVGQVIKLTGSAPAAKTHKPDIPEIEDFAIQAKDERTLYVTWYWKVPKGYANSTFEHYEVRWEYQTTTAVGQWFVGKTETTTEQVSVYESIPDKVWKVRAKITPKSKTKSSSTTTTYWTCGAAYTKTHVFAAEYPVPSAPWVRVEGDYLFTGTDDIPLDADANPSAYKVKFELYKDGNKTGTTSTVKVLATRSAETKFQIEKTDSKYKVCCYLILANDANNPSDQSAFSDEVEGLPKAPNKITVCRATSKTSVYLEWDVESSGILSSKTYKIQYTTNPRYFEGSDGVTTLPDIKQPHYEITSGLEAGKEYFFRVCVSKMIGDSDWTEPVSIVLGTKASVPTTWSSSTTVITGEDLVLYWLHNAEDGSRQSKAEVEITIGGNLTTEVFETEEDDEDEDIVRSFTINTSSYTEGTEIKWRVRTMGVIKEYGDWSIQRTVTVYARPTLAMYVRNNEGATFDELESLPFTITAKHTPNTQNVVGYHVSIIAKEAHEIVDNTGTIKMVPADGEVYSKYIDTKDDLSIEISANDVTLMNGIEYTVKCIVSLDSGLTAEDSKEFLVTWDVVYFPPNAEIGIDFKNLTATIQPYCVDDADVFLEEMVMSVYRRGQDGSLVEIATNIVNDGTTTITDPHPTLDYARYRIVARDTTTGKVSYYDLPGIEVLHSAVVIQWEEAWQNFDHPQYNEDDVATPVWGGSMVKLPYNIEVSSDYQSDVTLVNYIGRKYPVSYHGTKVDESITITTVVPKTDLETLYALRRLASWSGSVYVRTPSGAGYWAVVAVALSESYDVLAVPVSIKVTRVEGGI